MNVKNLAVNHAALLTCHSVNSPLLPLNCLSPSAGLAVSSRDEMELGMVGSLRKRSHLHKYRHKKRDRERESQLGWRAARGRAGADR